MQRCVWYLYLSFWVTRVKFSLSRGNIIHVFSCCARSTPLFYIDSFFSYHNFNKCGSSSFALWLIKAVCLVHLGFMNIWTMMSSSNYHLLASLDWCVSKNKPYGRKKTTHTNKNTGKLRMFFRFSFTSLLCTTCSPTFTNPVPINNLPRFCCCHTVFLKGFFFSSAAVKMVYYFFCHPCQSLWPSSWFLRLVVKVKLLTLTATLGSPMHPGWPLKPNCLQESKHS